MITLNKDNIIIPFVEDLDIDRYNDISIQEANENNIELSGFYKLLEKTNLENKKELNDYLGGRKRYYIIDFQRDEFDIYAYNEYISTIPSSAPIICNKLSFLQSALYDVGELNFYLNRKNDKAKILEELQNKYSFIDKISKIRDLPKMTKVLKMIYDGIKDTFKIQYDGEQLLAKLSDLLSNTSEKYIMEISTDPRDILTASVSKNFTSCFDISRQACNCASVNYLAIDNTTAVLKIYKYNNTNLECMKKGVMPYKDAVARRFLNFTFVDGKLHQLSLNRAYPDMSILDTNQLEKIINDDLIKRERIDATCVYAEYGNNYAGYEDLNKSGNFTYLYEGDKYRSIKVGDKGCVARIKECNCWEISTSKPLIKDSLFILYDEKLREEE